EWARLRPARPDRPAGGASGGGSAAIDAVQRRRRPSVPRLNDTQLVILSAAANRRDGAALPLPKSLKTKGGALAAILDSLRKKGLLEERLAARDQVAWRESEDGRRLALFATDAGLQALGVARDGAAKIRSVRSKAQSKPRRHPA